jgi:hypothetical protein
MEDAVSAVKMQATVGYVPLITNLAQLMIFPALKQHASAEL